MFSIRDHLTFQHWPLVHIFLDKTVQIRVSLFRRVMNKRVFRNQICLPAFMLRFVTCVWSWEVSTFFLSLIAKRTVTDGIFLLFVLLNLDMATLPGNETTISQLNKAHFALLELCISDAKRFSAGIVGKGVHCRRQLVTKIHAWFTFICRRNGSRFLESRNN